VFLMGEATSGPTCRKKLNLVSNADAYLPLNGPHRGHTKLYLEDILLLHSIY
jgi:hypothetical protein